MDTAVFKELQLLVTNSSDYPHLSIGLTSSADTGAAAFIASSAAYDKLVSMALTRSILQGLREYAFAKQAHAALASQCEEGAVLLFEAFEVDRPPEQKTLAALVHVRKTKALSQALTRMRIFCEHMTLPEAKTWIQCRPSKTLRTLIKAQLFRTWMKYYCQVPQIQSGSKCLCVHCDGIMDIYGFHLLHCERKIYGIRRHDEQVRLLDADMIKATRHPVVEPRPFGRHKERPDISALGSHGGSDMFDISFCHPLTPPRVRDGMENAPNLLKKAWDEKIRRFGRVLHESATDVKLFPKPLSNLGGWHPNALRAMRSIAVKIASRTLNSLEYASQTLFRRHAALLVANNAVCLISGLDLRIRDGHRNVV